MIFNPESIIRRPGLLGQLLGLPITTNPAAEN
jgi:hypothetical protein